MGFSSELAIETHNAAMESDAEYAETYLRHCQEEEMMFRDDEMEYCGFEPEEAEIDWFPDFRLAYDGYEEFDCDLCGKLNTVPFPHKECADEENAWSNRNMEFFN